MPYRDVFKNEMLPLWLLRIKCLLNYQESELSTGAILLHPLTCGVTEDTVP